MRNRESEEMYLETILLLKEKQDVVRSVDVVEELSYAKSSVSRAVNLLKSRGYLYFEEDGNIILTDAGVARAAEILERHEVITKALEKMGADHEMAEENACRIEHVVSSEMFSIIKKFAEKQ